MPNLCLQLLLLQLDMGVDTTPLAPIVGLGLELLYLVCLMLLHLADTFWPRIGDLILLPRLVTLQPTGEVLEAARAIAPFLIQLHLCFYETFW